MSSTAFKDDVSKGALQITAYSILFSISFSHMLNDTMQSLIPSIYPLLKNSFNLNFAQIGLIQLTFQLTASILQPVVGTFTDKRPQPFSLAIGMCFTLIGLIFISFANSYAAILVSVALIGTGSSIFHPESSKIAFLASGGRRGFAQSVFQVGGNLGTAIGPLLAAFVIVRFGRSHAGYFGILALLAIAILIYVGRWAKPRMLRLRAEKKKGNLKEYHSALTKRQVHVSVAILLILIFSKYFYLASIGSYYTFYLIEKFHVSIRDSQFFLFAFLAASAMGTYFGGPLGDRFGRKYVIWFSILGAAPFTLLLPYVSLFWTAVLSVIIGFIISSAFPAIIVYAQELMPGKIGMISGLFFGFAFGMGGLGSALLGILADATDIYFVYHVCAFLPLIGLITWKLPDLKHIH
ncbi:MAG TPA: MFS transporter [Bacteroidia bacterium]|nr:MFS transporter [Bacteroidota bacterium]MCB8930099.1 MFS transporter [Bacteroidia bacterium]OQB65761.1 MAG: Fosmidomycin resistance protein [Bacteroidetes bacterium ADurb.Bin141]MCO5288623.1 MFS transporter [Bacteroidota bacterium]MCW5930997.1 MFS transporter [Bacteroidota bacterium]